MGPTSPQGRPWGAWCRAEGVREGSADRAVPHQAGRPGPGPSGAGAEGPQFDLGNRGAGGQPPPWLALAPLSALLSAPPPCMAQKKKKKRKEPPRQLDMLQKPPGSLGSRKPRGRGGGQALRRVGVQERDFGSGEELPPGFPARTGTLRDSWKWPRRARQPGVRAQAPGNTVRGKLQAHTPGLGPMGRSVWKQREAQRQGPLNLSPSARPPTPNHSIQDSWAEPAGLLGPRGGVGAQSKRGLHTLNAASRHFPPPTQQNWGGRPGWACCSQDARRKVQPCPPPTPNVPRTWPRPPTPNLSSLLLQVNLRSRPRQQEGGRGWGCGLGHRLGPQGERDVTSQPQSS